MLSGNLLLASFRKDRAYPKFLKGNDEEKALAANLLDILEHSPGETREMIEESLKEIPAKNPKVAEGMAKILLDHAQFAQPEEGNPQELRSQVFDAAADYWTHRAQEATDLEAHRAQVLGPLGLAQPERLENPLGWLFADLPSNQRLEAFEPFTPGQLIDRFNLEQAQGLLLKAVSLRLSISGRAALGPLMQRLKFFGLMFRVEKERQGILSLVIDGPTSVLENPRSYGLELANFFPAVFSLPGTWEVKAQIKPQGKKGSFDFLVHQDSGYRSPSPPRDQWAQEKMVQVEKRFNEQYNPHYHARLIAEVIPLPGNRYLLPDLEVSQDGQTLQLQWVRYLTPERIDWLKEIRPHLPKRYYFAVKGKQAKLKPLIEAMDGRLVAVATEITAPFLKRLLHKA